MNHQTQLLWRSHQTFLDTWSFGKDSKVLVGIYNQQSQGTSRELCITTQKKLTNDSGKSTMNEDV